MGAAWAWPCEDRQPRKRYIEARKPKAAKTYLHSDQQLEAINEPTIAVDSVRTTQLDRYLKDTDSAASEVLAVCVHPLHPEETLVVIDTASEPSLRHSYRAFDFSLSGETLDDWIPLIKHELSSHHELHGRTFIGASQAPLGSGFYLAFSQDSPRVDEPSSTYYVRGICDFISREILSSLLNEVQSKKKAYFRASLMRENMMLLIFELKDSFTDFSYLVVDCPEVDLYSPSMKANLATRIESNVADENIEFISFIANPMRRELFMVFAMFP
jgi:hypothetical protein